MLLKKTAKYMKAHPRMINVFDCQDPPKHLDIKSRHGLRRMQKDTPVDERRHCDARHHIIKSWSTTQSIIALSSGEAEYYGVVKGVVRQSESQACSWT